MFPQQTQILGMLRKEIMTQSGLLTRKVRGEWVDKYKKREASDLVGVEKFDMQSTKLQNFACITSLGSIFLMQILSLNQQVLTSLWMCSS